MGFGERVARLEQKAGSLIDGESTVPHQQVERCALQELQHYVRSARIRGPSFWAELIGSCPLIPLGTVYAGDSVSSWMWFSPSSTCTGPGITGNNSTQFLSVQLVDYTQNNVTYSLCKSVSSLLSQGNCSATPVTGGIAEWILERPFFSWNGMGPINCFDKNYLPKLLDVVGATISQAETWDTQWHWFSAFSNDKLYSMYDNENEGFCDNNTGNELAYPTSNGSSVVQMNFDNYY